MATCLVPGSISTAPQMVPRIQSAVISEHNQEDAHRWVCPLPRPPKKNKILFASSWIPPPAWLADPLIIPFS